MESRSLVLDLKIRTKRELLAKIKQTVKSGMLRDHGLTQEQESEVMEFITDNLDSLKDISLRMCEKIAILCKMDSDWRIIAKTVCCK